MKPCATESLLEYIKSAFFLPESSANSTRQVSQAKQDLQPLDPINDHENKQ